MRALLRWPLSILSFELINGGLVLVLSFIHTLPHLSMTTYSSLTLPSQLPPMELSWAVSTLAMGQLSCPCPISTRDQFLLSPSDQCLSPLYPKCQGPFTLIRIICLAANFDGLPCWIHRSQCKAFTPLPRDKVCSYVSTPIGPCSLKHHRTRRSMTLVLLWDNEASPGSHVWLYCIGHRLIPLTLLSICVQSNSYIWRSEVQETLTCNKQSLQIELGNRPIAGCWEPITVPISLSLSSLIFDNLLYDQTEDNYKKVATQIQSCPYWSCQYQLPYVYPHSDLFQHHKYGALYLYITGIPGEIWMLLVSLAISSNPGTYWTWLTSTENKCTSTQALETGELQEETQHSSKLITSLISSLLNNTNLSFHLLLQTLTSSYQLLNINQSDGFGDCWLCVSSGMSSTLPLTVCPITDK